MSVDLDTDTDPGQEELDALHDAVLKGYEEPTSGYYDLRANGVSISRSSTLNSEFSVVPPAAVPVPFPLPPTTSASDIDISKQPDHSSETVASSRSSTSSFSSSLRDHGGLESPLLNRSFSEPLPSSHAAAAQVVPASTRRRPLPRPPSSQNESPTSSSRASIQPQPSNSSTASQRQPQQPQQALASTSNSSQIRRRPTQKNFPQPVVFAPERELGIDLSTATDPSTYEEEPVPTDPATEYADPYAAYLPKYYPDARYDPNAVSLAFTPMAGTQSRPRASTDHGEAIGTFMNFDILRRPSQSESLRLAYHEEGQDHDSYTNDTHPESYDHSASNTTTITTPTPRSTTPHILNGSLVHPSNFDQHQNRGSGFSSFMSPITTTTDRSFSLHAPSTSTRNATLDVTSPASPRNNTLWSQTNTHAPHHHSDDLDPKLDDQDIDLDSETDLIRLIASVPSYNPGPLGVHELGLDPHYYSGGGPVPGPSTSSHSYLYNYAYTTAATSELDERRFMNISLLSNIAVQLRDKVPRGTHVKGSIPYPRAFTGKDVVSTLHSIITRELLHQSGIPPPDRRAALLVARSLQNLLFFYEVEWGSRVLQDGVEDVYMFMDDEEIGSGGGGGGSTSASSANEAGPSTSKNNASNEKGAGSSAKVAPSATEGIESHLSPSPIERTELPTGIITFLTKCYAPICDGTGGCYAYDCPRRGLSQLPSVIESPTGQKKEEWSKKVPAEVLASLSETEITRQTIIHKMISKEEQYLADLDMIHDTFVKGLRLAQPPLMTPLVLEDFIEEVFGNILELKECNKRLLDVMYVRQREQYPVIQSVGDIFLDAATEFRGVYPNYVGRYPMAEKRLREEMEQNPEFRIFLEKCSRTLSSRPGSSSNLRLDLKHYLTRPSEHLQKYPVLLEAVYRETHPSNPDGDYLVAAIAAIQSLQDVARLRTFQSAMGKGATGKWEWYDLISAEQRQGFTQEEGRRQSIIFELIKGEMAYVRDLENIETMYIRPLRNAEPPIVPPDRLDQFLTDVFHNHNELHAHHRRLVDTLHDIQREEHPRIRSITAAVYDAVLNFREAYMEYIPNYPIAAYRIDEEVAGNTAFKAFVENTVRHPDAHRLDMKNFINRPIPRLLRYELLLKQILSETPGSHNDRKEVPPVIELIKSLGRETEPGVANAKQKVELWKYNSSLVFKSGEYVDMDLLNEQRSLILTGKLLRQPDGGLEWSGWTELFVMLFDNYLLLTKSREKDGVTKFQVERRPVPLDLLTLGSFSDPVVQRPIGILRALRNGDASTSPSSRRPSDTDNRTVYPFTIHHNGRLGGVTTLFAESAAIRDEWKTKLEEALGLRQVVQELNKVFAIENLSVDTFLLPSLNTGPTSAVWQDGTFFTGKVTCSVPFKTPDGRGLIAIGCAEGVWIGYRYDSRSLRRVLNLKIVTQCAVLEDFGLFLVLADKVLYAYHLEALVPTVPGNIYSSQSPQRIHGKDVHFFSVGVLHGRTMIIYMKKRGNNDSVFHAVEPILDKINERPRASGSGLLGGIIRNKTEWFRPYKEFSSTDAHDLVFLKAKIAVLGSKGFMIMDLIDIKGVTIPQRNHPNHPYLAKRCESCRPLGMFRPSEDEFLLCYNEFGLFVDRHGNPSRNTGIIEWEGTAERVAMHAPYILLFDSHLIEIRHIETGRLVQVIQGNDIRCVWDGRTLNGGAAVVPPGDNTILQEPRVHAVMSMPELPPAQTGPGGRQLRGVMQQVFELFPTIPLYLPGALSSPSTAPYFPVSFSPPRSPPLRPNHP